jgi:hypothetical protein
MTRKIVTFRNFANSPEFASPLKGICTIQCNMCPVYWNLQGPPICRQPTARIMANGVAAGATSLVGKLSCCC